jgi:hypothetical protein
LPHPPAHHRPTDPPAAGHRSPVPPEPDTAPPDRDPANRDTANRDADPANRDTGRAVVAPGRDDRESAHGRAETTPTGGLAHLSHHSRPATEPAAPQPAGTQSAGPDDVVIPLPRRPADTEQAAGRAAAAGGWRVVEVETTAMSPEQFTAAVKALSALITEWNQRPTDSTEKTREAA